MADATTTNVQNQFLDSVKAGQEAWTGLVRSWADSVSGLYSPVTAGSVGVFTFAQRLLDNQREYAIRVLEALEPVTQERPASARSASATK